MEKLWTTTEVAHFLGIDELDVEELVRQGSLTGYRLGGRFLRFRPDQVQSLKGTLRPQPGKARLTAQRPDGWIAHTQDFLYFYDFFLVSATCLAAIVVYLLAA